MDDLRREHPRLKAIIVKDATASNGPHTTHLKNKDFRFVLGAKPGDHELLFSWFEASESKQSWKTRDKKTGTVHHFEWDIGLSLNNAPATRNALDKSRASAACPIRWCLCKQMKRECVSG